MHAPKLHLSVYHHYHHHHHGYIPIISIHQYHCWHIPIGIAIGWLSLSRSPTSAQLVAGLPDFLAAAYTQQTRCGLIVTCECSTWSILDDDQFGIFGSPVDRSQSHQVAETAKLLVFFVPNYRTPLVKITAVVVCLVPNVQPRPLSSPIPIHTPKNINTSRIRVIWQLKITLPLWRCFCKKGLATKHSAGPAREGKLRSTILLLATKRVVSWKSKSTNVQGSHHEKSTHG